jgi:hypothetical protein
MSTQATLEGDTGPFSEYVSEHELAELLPGKPKTRTLRRWRSLNEGPPPTRIGNKIFYHIDDVKEWLREQVNDGGANARAA